MCYIIDYFFFKYLIVLMFLTYKLGVLSKKKKMRDLIYWVLIGCNMVLIKFLKRKYIVVSLLVCYCVFLLIILVLDKDYFKWRISVKIYWG